MPFYGSLGAVGINGALYQCFYLRKRDTGGVVMGIFSFLSRDRDYEDIDLAAEPEEEQSPAPGQDLPGLINGMTIEVLDEKKRTLNNGTITSASSSGFTLGRLPGGLSFKVCEPGTTVFIRGCDDKMMQFFLRAKVAESTRVLMRLTDLEAEVHENHRSAFRLKVDAPISIYYFNDERYERPEKCTLVDISTGGCCFISQYLHGEGEVLRLKVKLEDYVAMDFVGEVIRVEECAPNEFRCGVLFAQLKQDEINSLTKMLFNMQLGNRREHSRSEDGHW